MTAVDSYDVAVPSAGIYATLTRTPCGQWVQDWGAECVLRLSGLAPISGGVQRWCLRMDSWVVATSDANGGWVNNTGEKLQVTIVPTMWNILKRVSLIEKNTIANVNAAIMSVKEAREELTQKVAQTEQQQKSHAEAVARLLVTQSQEHQRMTQDVANLAGFDSKLDAVRAIAEQSQADLNKLAADLASRVDATSHAEVVKELEALREQIHYACVKKEPGHDINEAIEQFEVLQSTVGNCLLRNDEMNQTIDRLAKDVKLLQRDVGSLSARSQLVVDLSDPPEIIPPELEPGEIPECVCKRRRR